MFNFAMDFMESILCLDCNLERIFKKIKKAYDQVDYTNTLKCLVRAKIS